MQTNLADLQKAFALATKASESPDTPARERNYFRTVAYLIWKSCGKPQDQHALRAAAKEAN